MIVLSITHSGVLCKGMAQIPTLPATNAIAPAIVLLTRDIGALVVLEAVFAFIGVSRYVQSTAMPEWSRILLLSRSWIIEIGGNPLVHWWTYLPVNLASIILGTGWNALEDGLNTILNPRETV